MVTKTANLSSVFENLNNLKNAFKIGEKVVPIIQNLTEFMHEIVPLLESINHSISDSASQMPKAKNQINDVTSATELATTEILDLVDEISNRVMTIDTGLTELEEKQLKKESILKELGDVVSDNPKALELLNQLKEHNNVQEKITAVKEATAKINEDSYKITLSLQVQDITSQQLSAVNHLIENVNEKLQKLMSQIDSSELKKEFNNLQIEVPEDAHYDPNARYEHDDARQKKVDDIIEDQKKQASQDEIDKLFA